MAKRQADTRAFREALTVASANWATFLTRWQERAGDGTFLRLKGDVTRAHAEYLDLPRLREERFRQLRARIVEDQRTRYLTDHRLLIHRLE